ncbi:hypothetical protein EST38_g1166 [Candolleomyces aberdarensis]|uniref:PUB domain-containing protein n=1 Tax=Candolleomyces aberdarensis TaxID=2316362 RepID=A0A4Q2DW80_9AGAR|nr:hypothetical protein EST38_g1166 [Candolleomyces aberdarensis]
MASPSPPSSPQAAASNPIISAEALAAAAERRNRENPRQQTAAQLAQEHERKQKFRRMVNPGIMRPNPKEQALSSLKVRQTPSYLVFFLVPTLLKIAENLLNEPDNPKYQQFKPTNTAIKRELIDRKGVLEYAIELGFRPDVENFQPYYRWHKRHLEDLQVGTEILKEFMEVHKREEERASVSKLTIQEERRAAAEKVKLAYMDDRKTKMERDEMERQARGARASSSRPDGPARARIAGSPTREAEMPGQGETLTSPPPYEPPVDSD